MIHVKSEISVFLIERKKTLRVSHAKEMMIKKDMLLFLIEKCPYDKTDLILFFSVDQFQN